MSERSEWQQRVDALPAEEWTPMASALMSLMSDLSEECWCAGWCGGTEFAVWDLLTGTRTAWGQGPWRPVEEAVAPIRAVAEAAGVWIVWRGGPVAVDLDAWHSAAALERDHV